MIIRNHYFHIELSIIFIIWFNILVLSHTKSTWVVISLLFVNVTFSMWLWMGFSSSSTSFAARSLQRSRIYHRIVNDNWSRSLVNLTLITCLLAWNTHRLRLLKGKFLWRIIHLLLCLSFDQWSFSCLFVLSGTCGRSTSWSVLAHLLLCRRVVLLTVCSIIVVMGRWLRGLNDDLIRLRMAFLVSVEIAVSFLVV